MYIYTHRISQEVYVISFTELEWKPNEDACTIDFACWKVRSIGHCRFSLVLQIGRHEEPAKFSDVPLKTELEIKTAQDNSRIQICQIDNMLCSGRATSRFLWSRIVPRLQAKSQCDAWDHHWGSVGFCWILHDLVMFQYVSTGGSSLNLGMHQECLLYPSFPLKHDVGLELQDPRWTMLISQVVENGTVDPACVFPKQPPGCRSK